MSKPISLITLKTYDYLSVVLIPASNSQPVSRFPKFVNSSMRVKKPSIPRMNSAFKLKIAIYATRDIYEISHATVKNLYRSVPCCKSIKKEDNRKSRRRKNHNNTKFSFKIPTLLYQKQYILFGEPSSIHFNMKNKF